MNSEPPLVTKIRESVNYFILFSGLRGPSPWGHSIRRSTAASPPLLRFAARVQLPRRKGPGTHWPPSAALLSDAATCSACRASPLCPPLQCPTKKIDRKTLKTPSPGLLQTLSLENIFSLCSRRLFGSFGYHKAFLRRQNHPTYRTCFKTLSQLFENFVGRPFFMSNP